MAVRKGKLQSAQPTDPADSTAGTDEVKVLEYMIAQNRPYSAMDVFQNLHGAISRPNVNRALATLEQQGKLDSKTFSKQVIYVAKQNQIEPEEVQMQVDNPAGESIEEIKAEIQLLTESINNKKIWSDKLSKTLETSQLASRDQELEHQIAEARTKLAYLQENSRKGTAASSEEYDKIQKESETMQREWRCRRNMFMNMWNIVQENVMNPTELWTDLDLEPDSAQDLLVLKT
ncbi:Tat binding protein 1-interacting protein-domain-containing protein [Lipomyces oligophaga]|uniref:Tat binding protein 1-interacting protein-domain-containing protein n=1 Tax=Lipomyces oligophaga TaxID=45792 RepID=UPI0034CD0F52